MNNKIFNVDVDIDMNVWDNARNVIEATSSIDSMDRVIDSCIFGGDVSH
jgi:hypothetical protein